MRLALEAFRCSSLVILVVVGAATGSLVAVARLVSVNREITTRNVPALALELSLREALWKQQPDRIESDLAQLGRLLATEEERLRANNLVLAVAGYRVAVAPEVTAAGRAGPLHVQETAQPGVRAAAQRIEATLGKPVHRRLAEEMTE